MVKRSATTALLVAAVTCVSATWVISSSAAPLKAKPRLQDTSRMHLIAADRASDVVSSWVTAHSWTGYDGGSINRATDVETVYVTSPAPKQLLDTLASAGLKQHVVLRRAAYTLTALDNEIRRITKTAAGTKYGFAMIAPAAD